MPIKLICPVIVTTQEREAVLKSLRQLEASSRFEQVESAEKHTFEWLFEDSKLGFLEWLKTGHGLYWMRGKPASGKSTLMKMAYNDLRTKECLDVGDGKKTRAAFFFHDRGSEVQKSFQGLLQSIVYQVLYEVPELLPRILPIYQERLNGKQVHWDESGLQQALDQVLDQNDLQVDVCLFIDALDEYSGKHENIAKFLHRIVNMKQETLTKIKVFFSSRPLQVFLDRFDHVQGFSLHEWTAHDIDTVIHAKMKENVRMRRYLQSSVSEEAQAVQTLAKEISERAQGVFLWVRLVLDELLERVTAGDSLKELTELLSILPTELEQFYERLLERIPPAYHEETSIMFEVVQCVAEPLLLHDFVEVCRSARLTKLADFSSCTSIDVRQDSDAMARRVRSRSGGLVELVIITQEEREMRCLCPVEAQSDERTSVVQLLHQTAKSYLQRRDVRTDIQNAHEAPDNGYVYMLKYILVICSLYLTGRNENPEKKLNSTVLSQLEYYATHTELTTKKSHIELFQELGDAGVFWLTEEFAGMLHLRPHVESVASFAVALRLPRLVKDLLGQGCLQRQYQMPLLHLAMPQGNEILEIWSSIEIVKMLLEKGADIAALHDGRTAFQTLWSSPYFQEADHLQGLFAKLLYELLRGGQNPDQVVYHGEDRNWGDVSADGRYGSGLHRIVLLHDSDSARVLLQFGANVNALDSEGQTPLDYALSSIYGVLQWALSDSLGKPLELSEGLKKDSIGRLEIATVLLDNGGKISPSFDITGLTAYQVYSDFERKFTEARGPITKENIEALWSYGFKVDGRLLDPPRLPGDNTPDQPSDEPPEEPPDELASAGSRWTPWLRHLPIFSR